MDRPINEYYEYAVEFIKLTWEQKFAIGINLNILDAESDWGLSEPTLEEEVFTESIRKGLFIPLKALLFKELESKN